MANVFLSFFRISMSVSLVVVALVLLAPFLNKRYASKWKYWVWIFLALRLLLPVSGADVKSGWDAIFLRNTPAILEPAENRTGDPTTGQLGIPGQIVVEIPAQMTAPISMQLTDKNLSITLLDIAAFVWMLGSLVFLSGHLLSYWNYKRQVIKRGREIGETGVLSQIEELKRELCIRCDIHAVEYSEASSPMIVGFLRPVLILPDEQYTSGELIFILKHELIHWKRRDVYTKLLLVAANAVHWFNPFIWILRKEAVIDMELACDEQVTQGADYAMRQAYTETLLSTLHRKCVRKTALSTQFYGGKKIMKKRFLNILENAGKRNGAVILIGVTLLTFCLGTLIGCSATREEADKIPGSGEPEITFPEDELLFPVDEMFLLEDVPFSPDESEDELDGLLPGPEDMNELQPVSDIPQDGQIYGYLSGFENGSATVDWQLWITSEDENWEPEYEQAAGFEVLDVWGDDLVYPVSENCTYSVLENHHTPVVELGEEEFEAYLAEMEYPVLWVIQLVEGQITSISEQYVP